MISEKHSELRLRFSFSWEYILVSLLFASVIAYITCRLSALSPERYSQFIVGSITWTMESKQPDYILLFSFVIGFFISHAGLFFISNLIQRSNGKFAVIGFRQLLVYSLLPCGILLGKVLVNPDDLFIKPNDVVLRISIEMLGLSLFSIFIVVGFAIALTIKHFSNLSTQEYVESIGASLLFILFSFLAGIALVFTIGRVHLSWQLQYDDQVALVAGIGALLMGVPLLKVWLEPCTDFRLFQEKLRFLLWSSQGFFPLFFLNLLPIPWIGEKGKFYGYSIGSIFIILLVSLVTATWIHWFSCRKRRFNLNGSIESSPIFSALSVPCLIGLLLFVKASGAGLSQMQINDYRMGEIFLPLDDYHLGEILLPWWLWQKFHTIPFWDYEPSRGLVNYVPGLLANTFLDGSVSSYLSILRASLTVLPYLTIGFVAISQIIGILPAFLASLLMPINGISEIDVVLTAALCGLGTYFLKQQWVRWLIVWGCTSIALLLFAPGQGGLLILSTFPLAGWALWQAIHKERRVLLLALASSSLLLGLLCLTTPLGKMLVGAVRYGVEQSSINSVAHGIAWSLGVGKNPSLSYSLWEMLRTSWILVGLVAGLLLFRAALDKTWVQRGRYTVFGLPIVLLTILFIPRAAGRIDPSSLSRLGIASIWAVCLLLPIVLLIAFGQRRKPFSLLIVAFFGGMLVGLPLSDSLLAKPIRSIDTRSVQFTDVAQFGLPTFGKLVIEPEQVERIRRIKAVLDLVLDPGETYLDLTNRNANYFYLNHPVPIASGAYYNLSHRNQQLRAIQRLETSQPPIVLALADNMVFDAGSSSLRSYLLYRYVILHYIPVGLGSYVYLVRPDRLERLRTQLLTQVNGIELGKLTISDSLATRFQLLDQAFYVMNLEKIPRAWGQSFKTLQSEMRLLKVLDNTLISKLDAVEKTGATEYRITGSVPSIHFDVSSWQLNGRDAGILAFDFRQHGSGSPSVMEVSWSSQTFPATREGSKLRFSVKQGQVLVPLDTAPRWLLAEGIATLELKLVEPVSYSTFSLSNVALLQRTSTLSENF